MEQIQAIVLACLETQSPAIIQVSAGARKYADSDLLKGMASGAMNMMKRVAREEGLKEIPVALHLDHGADFDICKDCVDSGFSSVMIDGSHLPYKENVELTKKVVDYANRFDVSVEGELGVLAGVEDEVSSSASHYTKPEEVEDFVKKTGVGSLAISIGTSHGAYKFKVNSEDEIPPLRFDILEDIQKRLPNFPIVLHGASSVPQEAIEIINRFGGKIEKAFGVPEEQLRKAAKLAVCKINVDSDGRLWVTATLRKFLAENKSEFDPRKYLGEGREALKKMYADKNVKVFGSAYTVK
jgi:fructose-bisphosphate aldolase class II